MQFDSQFLSRTFGGASIVTGVAPRTFSFSVDSRTLVEGDIFVAMSGIELGAVAFSKTIPVEAKASSTGEVGRP